MSEAFAPVERLLYSIEDVCNALGLSHVTVRKMLKDGVLPSYRIGRKSIRVKKADVEAYIASQRLKWAKPQRKPKPEPEPKPKAEDRRAPDPSPEVWEQPIPIMVEPSIPSNIIVHCDQFLASNAKLCKCKTCGCSYNEWCAAWPFCECCVVVVVRP